MNITLKPNILILSLAGFLASCDERTSLESVENPISGVPDLESNKIELVHVDFNKDVRPILSDRCYSCHGPDAAAVAKSAGLRLDSIAAAQTATKDGHIPIIPGNPEESYILKRIRDASSPMPPLDSDHKQLSEDEIAILEKWIADGAEYTPHWAFSPISKVEPPDPSEEEWSSSEIDHFISAHLARNGVEPSPEADRATLLRRLSFVLTGLAPTPDELMSFIDDDSPDAYVNQVDRLLESPRFGERMASIWLDAARYADTNGYHHDDFRSSWPYRDYVVRAFNQNMPYDQFVIEQLAGDLLEEPTKDQLIASGFNRNHNINDEGGALDEEYRVEAIADRVETTGTVFLGLTMNCCRCHDHKYDPIEQQDYYNMYSFFNSFDEKGVYPHTFESSRAYPPYLELPTAEQTAERTGLRQQLASAKGDSEKGKAIETQLNKLDNRITRTLISKELPEAIQSYVLDRGAYDGAIKDRPAKRQALKFLGGELPEGAPKNRLGLAKWIVASSNPLTSRVHANRLWTVVFGSGLLKSQGDFGNQSPFPVYQELLDYLALELIESGWDQKAMLKELVMSRSFRQSARYRQEMRSVDPNNEWLSYYPRRRLPAEMLRDHALSSAGLLVEKLGGPPTKPYQPQGLWKERAIPSSNTTVYQRDSGEALYRRTLYTMVKRTAGPPIMTNFDAPSREACTVSRGTTNTPLQILQLWNDEQFLEISRVLAARVLSQNINDSQRLKEAFLLCTSREPQSSEIDVLLQNLNEFRDRYEQKPKEALLFLQQGEAPLPEDLSAPEHAAWSMTMSVILNLDETISLN